MTCCRWQTISLVGATVTEDPQAQRSYLSACSTLKHSIFQDATSVIITTSESAVYSMTCRAYHSYEVSLHFLSELICRIGCFYCGFDARMSSRAMYGSVLCGSLPTALPREQRLKMICSGSCMRRLGVRHNFDASSVCVCRCVAGSTLRRLGCLEA